MSGKFGDFIQDAVRQNSSDVRNISNISAEIRLQLKSLKSKFLDFFWQNRPNQRDMYLIGFEIALLSEFQYDLIEENLNSKVVEALKIYNYVEVDSSFDVINHQPVEDNLYNSMCAFSQNDKVVFFFGPDGIDTCINGHVIDKINIFYKETDLAAYSKKYHITQLTEALAYYQNTKITNPATYRLFFVDAAVINNIHPKHHKNVLRNSPERHFRDHLLDFLNTHTQHDFYKEIELPTSLRETDLFTEWNGKKYLIEIKWLGMCLNKDATGFTQPVTDQSARAGVVQTLEYVEELIVRMNINLKCGYLLVFDARDNKREINYDNFNNVPENLQPFLKNNFQLLDKLNVTNHHPA